MIKLIGSMLLSGILFMGFPTLPPPDKLIGQGFGSCPSGAMLEGTMYHVQDTPRVDWEVWRDLDGKVLAILVFVNEVVAQAWILKDGKVLEFNEIQEMLKVSQTPCDLFPKTVL